MKKKPVTRLLCLLLALSLLMGLAPPFTPAAVAEDSEPAPGGYFIDTISATGAFTLVLKEDGTVWGWGDDVTNSLGNHELGHNYLPVQVPLEKPARSVGTAQLTSFAITGDGELWNWGGDQGIGGMGREVEGYEVDPGKVMGGTADVAGGYLHTAALTGEGVLWAWGSNGHGQVGNGGEGLISNKYGGEVVYEPLPVLVLDNVADVEAGTDNTFAIRNDGSLWAWGVNTKGELANDTDIWDKKPFESHVSSVGNAYGEYNGRINARYQTVPVKVMEDVAKVDAAWYTIILKNDGTVWTAGFDYESTEEPGRYTFAPWRWTDFDDAVDVATGGECFAAIRSDGSLWTWSPFSTANKYGQLGRETPDRDSFFPQKVMDDVADVVVGPNYMAALKTDGSVWAWGNNEWGQLGVGEDVKMSSEPIKVIDGVALPGRYTDRLNEGQELPVEAVTQGAAISEDGQDMVTFSGRAGMRVPGNASYYNGNAYMGYTTPAGEYWTWEEASRYCQNMGGHLATVTSSGEQKFMNGYRYTAWIGGFITSNGKYSWVTGEKWGYSNWSRNALTAYTGDSLYMNSGGYWLPLRPGRYKGIDGFICEWETAGRKTPGLPAATYTVTFNANGGRCGTASLKVTQGRKYGVLPSATRSGYQFRGWYTSPSGGTQITKDTVVNLSGRQTLYAQWKSNSQRSPATVADVSYKFANSSAPVTGFNYPKGYRIPLNIFQYMFGKGSVARKLYNDMYKWDGNCYGMVTSAEMLYLHDAGLQPSSFRAGAVRPSQLKVTDVCRSLNMSLTQFNECMLIAQCGSTVMSTREKNSGAYNALASEVYKANKYAGLPVPISIFGPPGRGGHEIMGLGLYLDKNGRDHLIHVYDPNYPLDNNRYLKLYRSSAGSNGRYTGWYYEFQKNEPWGSGYRGRISFEPYPTALAVWNNRGSERAYRQQLLTLSTKNASIYDYAGNLAATIRDGEVTSLREDIYSMDAVMGPEDGTEDGGLSLWVPEEYFKVVNEDDSAEEFSLSLYGETAGAAVTTSADEVLIYSNDQDETATAMVTGDGESYEIVLTSGGEGEIEDGLNEVRLTGETKEGIPTTLSQTSGELSYTGVYLDEGGQLTINGEAGSGEDMEHTSVVALVSRSSPSVISSTFTDVPGGSYFAPAVEWALDTGAVQGTSSGAFTPDSTITRAEAITMLWRVLGCPEPVDDSSTFQDVDEEDYYYKAVLWAAGSGVTKGTGKTAFSPHRTCTDWQFLTLLWRALDHPGRIEDMAGYADAMDWAEEYGLLEDTGSEPPCLRRDAVTFLYRALA